MPTYEFKGRDLSGKFITGKRIAYSADSISFQLLKEGITPIEIHLAEAGGNAWKTLADWFAQGRVTSDDLGMFARQMHTLCKTGVPITLAIKRLAETARSARLTIALNGIAEILESGVDLAGAMQRYPKIFTPLMVSMVRVGQSSGNLDEAFLRLNQYIELESGVVKHIAAAMRYPMLILIALVVAVCVVNSFVIPSFAHIFERANIPLPFLTVALIKISNFTNQYWIYIAIGLAIAVTTMIYYFKTPEGKLFADQYRLKIPIIGRIMQRILLLRFAQMFSIVINSGVPILEGISLVAEALNNSYVQKELLGMREAIQRGNSLTQAATGITLFTPLEIQMLAVSEETGDLGELFHQIAIFYQREVEYDLKRLNDFMEPFLIVILSIFVLMLAFAVYLPIWNMVKLAHT